jgi:pyruvate carboxylase
MAETGRVLIANRGEIAIRVARAAAGLGLESVAVFAPIDAESLHTRFSTLACPIGSSTGTPADPVGAYLDIDALIGVAVGTGCDRVHPGYGFLAENARFAERCAAAGLSFVGPGPEALRLFGDKTRARGLPAPSGYRSWPAASNRSAPGRRPPPWPSVSATR